MSLDNGVIPTIAGFATGAAIQFGLRFLGQRNCNEIGIQFGRIALNFASFIGLFPGYKNSNIDRSVFAMCIGALAANFPPFQKMHFK